jgi:hypothetical protein
MPWSPVARPSVLRRTGAYALAACAALALAAPAAHAQTPFRLTFNGVNVSDPMGVGVVAVPNCYEEAGIRITVTGFGCGMPGANMAPVLASFTPAAATGWTGSPALFNNDGFSVDFMAASGNPFSLSTIDLASMFLVGTSPAMSVTFTGMRAGGLAAPTPMTCLISAGARALSTCTLTGFTNLTSVRMTPSGRTSASSSTTSPVIGTAVIPEPGTVLLVGAGLLGAAGFARRRRNVA